MVTGSSSLEKNAENVLKLFVLTLTFGKVVTSRGNRHIILSGYNVLVETAYNL